MSGTWKTARVFNSSTFSDMRAGRDYPVKFVLSSATMSSQDYSEALAAPLERGTHFLHTCHHNHLSPFTWTSHPGIVLESQQSELA